MAEVSAEPRAKRARVDKAGRFAALEKLKQLKGHKHKYTVEDEVDNVYEIVDEREYAKKAKERYGDDWIEEDGTGYAEDGRDFFEDEDEYSDEEQTTAGGAAKKKGNANNKRSREADKPAKGKGSIRNLFKNAVGKKTTNVKLDDDNILADILGELKDGKSVDALAPTSSKVIAPAKIVSVTSKKQEQKLAEDYINKFVSNSTNKIKEKAKLETQELKDDELLERVLKPTKQAEVNQASKIDAGQAKKLKLNESKIAEKKVEAAAISEETAALIMDMDDMDFTCLQDVENQIEQPKVAEANAAVAAAEQASVKVAAEQPSVKVAANVPAKEVKSSNTDDLADLLSNWEEICQADDFEQEIAADTANGTAAKAKITENLKFWWWDAWENPKKLPGVVFLFGRTATGESVAVRVQNISRVLYLLPREFLLDPITKEPTRQKVTLSDIYKEFEDDISNELKLQEFKSKKVTKNFANHTIGIDVPQVCDYMEVHYDGKKPPPNLKKKYNSIAHIFGANTTPLERFLLDRKIKGPCWLNINQFTQNTAPISWCKVDMTVTAMRHIVHVDEPKPAPPPPLTLLTLNVRTAISPRSLKNEVVMISMLVQNRFQIDKQAPKVPFNRHMCAFTRPTARNWPFDLAAEQSKFKTTRLFKHDTERALLSWFLAQYQQIDADLIVTFDKDDCQLNILADRVVALKLPQWSRLGRLRMSEPFKMVMDFFLGRMVCDVRHSAQECISSRSYDLQTLCTNVLKLNENQRLDLNTEDIEEMYESGKSIIKLITLTMQDAAYILRMMYEMNIMPLALQITNICGNIMNRTLQKGRNERNEFLLLHAFTEKNYIVPDKKMREWHDGNEVSTLDATAAGAASKKKAAYAGGLVLDPIKGLYDKYVLLLDFNSLYPSIIQEYNICFTTVQQPYNPEELPQLPAAGSEPGILPQQLRRLVESRREVKKLMAAPDLAPEQKIQYEIRQKALKLTANSMYGCLGFGLSRFYAQHLAALVTFKGREILMNTKSLVEKMNYTVVYGDTDSIMVNTNITEYDQVFKIGHSIKQSVNKTYKLLELDIDGVFSCLLLLKKKKYAAVKVSKNSKGELIKEQEQKGLDIVRRDWSQIAIMVGKSVLNSILQEKPLDEKLDEVHAQLSTVKDNILNGEVPLAMFQITKQLSKAPTEFNNTNSMPHVQVALRMNKTRNRRYKKGDMVEYVICDDGTNNPATQRAYHLDELKTNETLKIDKDYYLAQQIHPVVARMVEVLDGTDPARIAECLGLDPSKFRQAVQRSFEERNEDATGESIVKSTLQKYRLCEKFKFVCIDCKTENIVASAFRPSTVAANTAAKPTSSHEPVLLKCVNPDCNAAPYQYVIAIRNQLLLSMRKFITRFYQNWLVCDIPACNQNTRQYTHVVHGNRPVCSYCKQGTLVRQYTERDLYNQLSYFQYIFDLSKYQHKIKDVTLSTDVENAFHALRATVDQQLDKSAYCTIALSKLFWRLKPIEQSIVKLSCNRMDFPPVAIATSLEDE